MTKQNQYLNALEEANETTTRMVQKILESEDTARAFGKPVEAGDYKVITASETSTFLGFGFGFGTGDTNAEDEDEELNGGEEILEEKFGETTEEEKEGEEGMGGGTGAGAHTSSRPVAVITLKPHGVEVEPIVDVNKIALSGFAAASFISFMIAKAIVGSKRSKK